MSTEVATFDIPTSKYGPEDNNQETFTKKASFLPRIEFKSDQAKIVKMRKFAPNHYALVPSKDELIDLGETFVVFPLAYRYKALDFREKGKVGVAYDPKSPEFQAIMDEADKQRAPGEMSGCMYGAEFLLAFRLNDKVVVATLLCGSASWKAAAEKMFGLVKPVRRYISLGSKLVTGKYTYTAPEVAQFDGSFDLGDVEKLKGIASTFIAASGIVQEESEEAPEGEGRTR